MMEVTNICQICQECKSVKAIFDLRADDLKCFFGNTNYDEHSLICSKCFENIEDVLVFKKAFLKAESKIKLMCDVRKEFNLEIEDIVGTDVKTEDPECNLSICRICLEFSKISACVFLIEPKFKLKLNKCLPELTMDSVKDPVGCGKCLNMVEQYFSILQCFEDKIVKDEIVPYKEVPIVIDHLKQEDLEIKDEQQESNEQNYLDDNFDNGFTSLRAKERREGDKSNVLLMEGKQLTQVDTLGVHAAGKVIKPEPGDEQFDTEEHKKVDTQETQSVCQVCNRCFAKKNLQRHMRIHTGKKYFKCTICDKEFTRKYGLIGHMRIHTGEKPFACDVCNSRFSVKCNLTDHIKTHTVVKSFACDTCKKQFLQKRYLVEHMRLHTSEKTFACVICSTRFTAKTSLRTHMIMHTSEKPFKCGICDKGFVQESSLVDHMKIHSGEKPFKCDICVKGFTKESSLVEHTRIHTGEQPFNCDVCNVRFAVKGSLKKHARIHSREKTVASANAVQESI